MPAMTSQLQVKEMRRRRRRMMKRIRRMRSDQELDNFTKLLSLQS